MKFLQLCLCLSLAAVGTATLRAQQNLTPEQQKQVTEALRKALEQAGDSAPAKPAVPPPIESKPTVAPATPAVVPAAPAIDPADAKAAA